MTHLAPLPAPAPPKGFGRLPLGRWFLVAGVATMLAFVLGAALTVMTINMTRLDRESLVDVIDPAVLHTLEVSTALSAEENSIRTYGRTNEAQYLQDYRTALQSETAAFAKLSALVAQMRGEAPRADLRRLAETAAAWRRDYADVVIAKVPELKLQTATTYASVNTQRLAAVREALAAQQQTLGRMHDQGSARLEDGWRTVYFVLIALALVFVAAAVMFTLIVRYVVLRPISQLTQQVRAVTLGEFDRELHVAKPAELAELSGRVDAMRGRILREWRRTAEARQQLADQAVELRRSNAELEQFAYVASHDLQEPLRKVASFTQMLEQRYGDQLDDRAKQYVAFAVDGAKRMQLLINDLLDLSRVGRVGGEKAPVKTQRALDVALANLAAQIEDTGATVTHDELPEIHGNQVLITQLLQNLIGNALKFRSEEPPRVHISAERRDDMWEFACSDNGIGVESKYADRIFLIFQRLHPRDVYPGTGIGLALCRKIVEYHGGKIWLDDPAPGRPGTTFRWTLPASGDTDE
ncbi:histidine kinase [Sphaerisporangium krabiense]|uniref:histidine kinase n=1 Tax=Sphaerisporangium krabiense TaxID=763782 RepID=A0A7W8Z4R3_9ACTN|nr:ATP-binding protein [Sphaerisporangium krabiense]MBB5627432.1 signal transduction histidine kinase [Sphaerisporangium krabiense]GII64431.1 histidine kinase [Sphaerisporangium krabiense]